MPAKDDHKTPVGPVRARRRQVAGGAPAHLSEGSRALWDSMVREYALDGDDVGLAMLASALEARDRAEEARLILAKEGITIEDRFGNPKAHPASTIERDSRAAFINCLKALRLDVEENRPSAGRPPGSTRANGAR